MATERILYVYMRRRYLRNYCNLTSEVFRAKYKIFTTSRVVLKFSFSDSPKPWKASSNSGCILAEACTCTVYLIPLYHLQNYLNNVNGISTVGPKINLLDESNFCTYRPKTQPIQCIQYSYKAWTGQHRTCDLISGTCERFFSSPKSPERLWDPIIPLLKRRRVKADRVWSWLFTST